MIYPGIDLFAWPDQLRKEGIEIVGEPVDSEHRKFSWILDIDGN